MKGGCLIPAPVDNFLLHRLCYLGRSFPWFLTYFYLALSLTCSYLNCLREASLCLLFSSYTVMVNLYFHSDSVSSYCTLLLLNSSFGKGYIVKANKKSSKRWTSVLNSFLRFTISFQPYFSLNLSSEKILQLLRLSNSLRIDFESSLDSDSS